MVSVYLDTQHLSRSVSGQNELAKFFGNPLVELFFSITHVVESLPKNSAPSPNAIARLELMTGRQAKNLIGWADFVELERAGKITKLADLIVQPEQLFPAEPDFDPARMHKKVRENIKQFLRERIPDPNQRRSLQAKFLKHGKIRPEALALLRDQKANTVANLQKEMPDALPLIDAGGLYDFLEGRVSQSEFTKNFQRALLRPGGVRPTGGPSGHGCSPGFRHVFLAADRRTLQTHFESDTKTDCSSVEHGFVRLPTPSGFDGENRTRR